MLRTTAIPKDAKAYFVRGTRVVTSDSGEQGTFLEFGTQGIMAHIITPRGGLSMIPTKELFRRNPYPHTSKRSAGSR